MHIPDGYLGPAFSLGMGVLTVPAWAIASRRTQAILDNRTVPLLAAFSAFTFTVMMFNVPVPGGTTAHGVGGTLLAIVLGPWAATIGISTALIIQALFFGDGGILAIFANCFNMGVLLPWVGYLTYRAVAGRSSMSATRRIWAAGLAGYLALTASAVVVGLELGLQPLLYSEGGRAIYSPYGVREAIAAMLVSHLFGASIVEALITALGLVYLRRSHPDFLTLVAPAPHDGPATASPRFWPVAALLTVGAVILLGGAGLIDGGGNPGRLFGADWSQVSWGAVLEMLVVVAVIGAVTIPLAWLLLPRSVRKLGTMLLAVAVFAPLGLIAPGFAYGEGSPDDVQQAFGYIPHGLQSLSEFFSAPLAGYNLPFGFFAGEDAPLWRAAIGYEISGILGVLLLVGVIAALSAALRRRDQHLPPSPRDVLA